MSALILSDKFLWGASTSAYQIEGATDDDGRGASIWDTFCEKPGAITNGDKGNIACDHYHRFGEDLDLATQLGLDVYRFSIAWPRLLPEGTGRINSAGLEFYDRLIDGCLERGLQPWACLYHWDLPQSLQDRGGWSNRDIAGWFSDYAQIVGDRFGDRVAAFATFNEPNVFVIAGHVTGMHAPGLRDPAKAYRSLHHVNLAHGDAVQVLRGATKAPIGPILNQRPIRAATQASADQKTAAFLDALWNRAFAGPMVHGKYSPLLESLVAPAIHDGDLERIQQKIDFFGLNHYNPFTVKYDPDAPGDVGLMETPEGARTTPMGWEISGTAFEETILDVAQNYPNLPIYVTENGIGLDEPDGTEALND